MLLKAIAEFQYYLPELKSRNVKDEVLIDRAKEILFNAIKVDLQENLRSTCQLKNQDLLDIVISEIDAACSGYLPESAVENDFAFSLEIDTAKKLLEHLVDIDILKQRLLKQPQADLMRFIESYPNASSSAQAVVEATVLLLGQNEPQIIVS